ncbi:MAG: beta-L-arabinofuranosidase domain-containing protein [Bryobacteraceae bacterium]
MDTSTTPARPITPHYIYDKMMCGLVDLLEYNGRQDAVPLMEKITNWAVANLDRRRQTPLEKGATYDGGGEWYTLPENLYRAYQLTGRLQFKDFAEVWRYPAYWDMFGKSEEPDPFGFHAYSHVNTLSSAAMAGTVSGDSTYVTKIVNAFDWLERTQMYATGGFGPVEKLQRPDGSLGESLENTQLSFETVCGSWAGFKLGRYLIQFTGESKYGDWMEKLVYNGIGAALPMEPDGSTFYYSEYSINGGRKGYHPVKWPCCSGTYPQAVAEYQNILYFKDSDNLFVNLYIPSTVTWRHKDNEVRIEQQTAYPESETTSLTIMTAKSDVFGLKFRVPRWCSGFTVDVNGSRQRMEIRPGSWAVVRREWRAGDRVIVRIPMKLELAAIDKQHPNRAAVTYGPLVLVRRDTSPLLPGRGDLPSWIVRGSKALEFHASNQRWGPFLPFYKLGRGEAYHAYFDVERGKP